MTAIVTRALAQSRRITTLERFVDPDYGAINHVKEV
jgi:hypothetical protein